MHGVVLLLHFYHKSIWKLVEKLKSNNNDFLKFQVGVRIEVAPECVCGARNFVKPESCHSHVCYNGGRCLEGRWGVRCQCPRGFEGPRCQQTTRSFWGKGWAWYPPLELCEDSHLSIEFMTRKPDGTLLYNGPIGKYI